MKNSRIIYSLIGFLLILSGCTLLNDKATITEIELSNELGEDVYYSVIDYETLSLIDIRPIISLDELTFPLLKDNEAVRIDLKELEGFPIERLDGGIYVIYYSIRDGYNEVPGKIAVGNIYGLISYEDIVVNKGKVVLEVKITHHTN